MAAIPVQPEAPRLQAVPPLVQPPGGYSDDSDDEVSEEDASVEDLDSEFEELSEDAQLRVMRQAIRELVHEYGMDEE